MNNKFYKVDCSWFNGYDNLNSTNPDHWMRPADLPEDDPESICEEEAMREYDAKMLTLFQMRLLGIGLILVCIAIGLVASRGTTVWDQDATPVVVLGTLAYKLLTIKEFPVFDDPPYEEDDD